MIRCTCGAELFSIESVCSVCIHPKPPRAIYVEDLRIKLANREEEILDWKEATEIANNENIELRAERDRLKAALDIAKAHAKQNQRARDLVSPYPNDHAKRIVWERALYHDGKDLWDKLRKALGGDAS